MKIILEKIRLLKELKNKHLYLLAFLGFLLIVSAILQVLTPPQTHSNNSWNELTPGKSSLNDVQKKLGQPLDIVDHGAYKVLEYKSPFSMMPHEVAIDSNNQIIFIKEYLTYDENHVLNNYLEEYGEPDLELFAPMVSEAVKAYVFLDDGFLIIAHLQNKAVEQRWYFVPSSEEVFIQSWKKELTKIQKGPEKFISQ